MRNPKTKYAVAYMSQVKISWDLKRLRSDLDHGHEHDQSSSFELKFEFEIKVIQNPWKRRKEYDESKCGCRVFVLFIICVAQELILLFFGKNLLLVIQYQSYSWLLLSLDLCDQQNLKTLELALNPDKLGITNGQSKNKLKMITGCQPLLKVELAHNKGNS